MSSEEGVMLRTCMALRSGETVFVVFDPSRSAEAARVIEACQEIGCPVDSTATIGDVKKDEELPPALTEGLERAEVILFLVDTLQNQIFGHHPAKNRAVRRGARVGFVTTAVRDFSPEKVARIAEVSKHFADRLTEASTAHLRSAAGTDLTVDLSGRRPVYFTNYLTQPGAWGALPDYAEAAIAPVTGSAQGKLVIDGTIVGVGKLRQPVRVAIADGQIQAFDDSKECGQLRALLERGAGDIFAVAELGLGVNEFARSFTGEFDDKKILGSAHVGIGDNRSLHGDLRATIHIDLIMRSVSLLLDGKPLLEQGRLAQDI